MVYIKKSTYKKMIRSLGRWARKKPMVKVDLANHDHCGSSICRTSFVNNTYDNSMDVSLCALQSFHVNPNGISKQKKNKQK